MGEKCWQTEEEEEEEEHSQILARYGTRMYMS